MLSYGEQHSLDKLIAACKDFKRRNLSEILQFFSVCNLNYDEFSHLIQEKNQQIDEIVIYNSAMKWIKHDLESRKDHLNSLMNLIDFQKISPTNLRLVVDRDVIFQSSLVCQRLLVKALFHHFNTPESLPTHHNMRQLSSRSFGVWKPKWKLASISETEVFLRKVRSLLNKVSPENFNHLMDQFLSLEFNDEHKLMRTVEFLHERAILFSRRSPNYSPLYAKMCFMCKDIKTTNSNRLTLNLRTIVIRKCQNGFENIGNEKPCKIFGNLRFIAELYNVGLLADSVCHNIILKLLRYSDDDNLYLESLFIFLTSCGKKLDAQPHSQRMNQYFSQLCTMLDTRCLNLRTQFLLQDVIDLRNRLWVPSLVVRDLTPQLPNRL